MSASGPSGPLVILRLGSIFGFKILNFNIFLGFQKKIFFGV